MKHLLSLLFIVFSFIAHSQTITPEQAKDSIGKKVTVCGEVTRTDTAEQSGVTFLNMGGKYSNNSFNSLLHVKHSYFFLLTR